MNSRIDKIARDIEKTRTRIADDQARLKELERQKVDMENAEIVTLFRAVNVPPKDVAALIKAYRDGGESALPPVSAAPPANTAAYSRNDNFSQTAPEEEDTDV